MLKKNKNYPN